jgi:glutamate-5-semialdehyde dehydrogenase
MTTVASELEVKGAAAKAASRKMATLSSAVKDRALHAIADALVANEATILAANAEDCAEAEANGLDHHMIDRLKITAARLAGIAGDVRSVAALPWTSPRSVSSPATR